LKKTSSLKTNDRVRRSVMVEILQRWDGLSRLERDCLLARLADPAVPTRTMALRFAVSIRAIQRALVAVQEAFPEAFRL
jgi:hypothetical protein